MDFDELLGFIVKSLFMVSQSGNITVINITDTYGFHNIYEFPSVLTFRYC